MDLSLLLLRPVQYTVAQFGSLFGARDIEGWQLPVNWGVSYALLTWFLVSRLLFRLLTSTPCLPAFVGVIIFAVIVTTSLLASRTCLHHLYWGRHHSLVLPPAPLLVPAPPPAAGFLRGLLPPEPSAPPVVFFPTFMPSVSSRPSSSEVSSSP